MQEEYLKQKMVEKAREMYGDIEIIDHIGSLKDSFTEYRGKTYFWFNTKDHSTHTICSTKIEKPPIICQ